MFRVEINSIIFFSENRKRDLDCFLRDEESGKEGFFLRSDSIRDRIFQPIISDS